MLNCRWTFRGAALAALLLVVLAAAGCGKKGNPIPPGLILPPPIADLTTDSVPDGILLGWSAPGPIGRIDHFRIVRGDTTAEQACPGCPQEYRPFVTAKVAGPTLQRTGERDFRYLDADVTAGRFYSYRISACDSQGRCGEPSPPAQRFREKR